MSSIFGVIAIYSLNDVIQTSNKNPRTLDEELLSADQVIAKVKNGEVAEEDIVLLVEIYKDYRKSDHRVADSVQEMFFYGVIVFVCLLSFQLQFLFRYLRRENEKE